MLPIIRLSPSCRALYQELKDNRLFVVEECVVQCEKMNLLCPASINTPSDGDGSCRRKAISNIPWCVGNGTKAVDTYLQRRHVRPGG